MNGPLDEVDDYTLDTLAYQMIGDLPGGDFVAPDGWSIRDGSVIADIDRYDDNDELVESLVITITAERRSAS